MAKRRRRRPRRRMRKNPDTTTLLLVGGALAAAGYYFFVHRKKAAYGVPPGVVAAQKAYKKPAYKGPVLSFSNIASGRSLIGPLPYKGPVLSFDVARQMAAKSVPSSAGPAAGAKQLQGAGSLGHDGLGSLG